MLNTGIAALYSLFAGAMLATTRPDRSRLALAGASIATAGWAGMLAFGPVLADAPLAALDLGLMVAWSGFLLHLYHRSAPNGARQQRLFVGFGAIIVLVALAGFVSAGAGLSSGFVQMVEFEASLGLAVCALLLIENLYRNTPEELRWHITLPCVTLGGFFVYGVALYSDAVLFRRVSPILADGRAVLLLLLLPLLALAAKRNQRRWGRSLQVSHRAVFYSASLVLIGIFLLGVAATGEILRAFGPGWASPWGMVLEISLISGGLLVAAVFVTSASARSTVRNLVISNFFRNRYDYRLEWLRCIHTLSQTDRPVALHTRAIRAVAQVVDSPAGMIFLREAEDGVFRWAGSWNLPAAAHQIGGDHALVTLLGTAGLVIEVPPGTPDVADAWLAAPLAHGGGMTGFILVSRPRAPFALDEEVFALLRIVGQEVASYVAEQRAAEALLQTNQLREYGKRFTFVAHDIKNVSSQLSLVLANAEHHLANAEFQQDMLRTVGASVQKINTLLARLKTPPDALPPQAPVIVLGRLQAIIDACGASRRARILLEAEPLAGTAQVLMDPADFEAVVLHLLDNAFDASAPDAPVRIACREQDRRILVDIVDQGTGMTAEFIQQQLFRPFRSSKDDGFGMGVFQARELLQQVGGYLTVTSEPGAGTTMRVSLPLPAAMAAASVRVLP